MFKTKREFLNVVANGVTNDDTVEFAKLEIEKMDNRNNARSEKPTKKQLENEEVKVKIVEVLNVVVGKTAADIAKEVEISTQKASSLCRQLVEDGKAKAEQGKKNKVYFAVATDGEVEAG